MLLDTSGLLCYLDQNDANYDAAGTLLEAADRRITHNYVLAEFVALATARRLARPGALRFTADLLTSPHIEVIWVDQERHNAALSLLREQLDKTYSLCDAVSFLLMRERGLIEALTTDHHFEQAGFQRLLAP
jgi:predicted nucleic acid-binding protein